MSAIAPPRILVTHPGRQHSHQAALALQGAGMLAGYWAGVPCLERQARRVPSRLWQRFVRYAPVPLDPERVRWYPLAPALRRLGDAVLPRGPAARLDLLACRLFDRWAARGLSERRADAVIACEISALTTFQRARAQGLATLLDAPSIHHTAQDRLHRFAEPPDLHLRTTAIKDREIELADHVLTVSELARQTYVEAGVPPERVHAVPLGADLELFTPAAADDRRERQGGNGLTFLFCGAAIYRKGFDLVVRAFDRVAAEAPGTRLRVVGTAGDAAHHLDDRPRAGVQRTGPLPQTELAEELRRADCLVLPSRHDSYGMVVAEALASGLPVVVSEMVGAKELVSEGKSGWVVPVDDEGSLAERMLRCARDPEALRAMRPACRAAAEAATWPAYHHRLAELLGSLVADRRARR